MMKKTLFVASLALLSFTTAIAQTAEEIVQKHYTAIGGEAAWKKITATKLVGSINGGGAEMAVNITTVKNKGYKMELTVNGKVNYVLVTPTKGWMYFPVQGQDKPQPMAEEDVKDQQEQMDPSCSIDPLIDYKARGSKVTMLEKEKIDGKECYKLKVVTKKGKEHTLFLDANSYYIVRSIDKTIVEGQPQDAVSNMSNYMKLPEGIMFPMSIESQGGPIMLKAVEINKTYSDAIFKPGT